MTSSAETHLLRCRCGAVECVGSGPPIVTAVCYCDDCQAAGKQLEAMPGAAAVLDPDGGTTLTLFRTSRFELSQGGDHLFAHKLRPDSVTNRMVAGCCNSTMFLSFDKGPHWVSAMCNRLVGPQPPIAFRHMTKYRTSSLPYPDSVKTFPKFPLRLIWALMRDWAAVKLGG